MGKLAWIDLSNGTVKVEEIAEISGESTLEGLGLPRTSFGNFHSVRSIRSVLRMYWCSPRVP